MYTHLLCSLLRYSLVRGKGQTGRQPSADQGRSPGWRSKCRVINILMVFKATRLVQLSSERILTVRRRSLVPEHGARSTPCLGVREEGSSSELQQGQVGRNPQEPTSPTHNCQPNLEEGALPQFLPER